MSNFGFYATRSDVAAIVTFVLCDIECRILDAYSQPDAQLGEYHSVDEVLTAYPDPSIAASPPRPIHLTLWRPDFGPEPQARRIDFRPGRMDPHTHRFAAEGWGLINLQIGGHEHGRLAPSHLSVNSEARAMRWNDVQADRYGPVAAWDWRVVTRVMRQLQYHLGKRLAVGRHGRRPVLPGAASQIEMGTTFAEV